VTRRKLRVGLAVLAAAGAAATTVALLDRSTPHRPAAPGTPGHPHRPASAGAEVFAAGAFTLAGERDALSRRVVRNVWDHLED
jgi:hypothetical protein